MKKRVLSIVLVSALVGTMMAQEVEHRKEVYVIKAGKASGINTANPVEQKEIGKAVMEFMYDYKYLTDTTDVSRNETDRMTKLYRWRDLQHLQELSARALHCHRQGFYRLVPL